MLIDWLSALAQEVAPAELRGGDLQWVAVSSGPALHDNVVLFGLPARGGPPALVAKTCRDQRFGWTLEAEHEHLIALHRLLPEGSTDVAPRPLALRSFEGRPLLLMSYCEGKRLRSVLKESWQEPSRIEDLFEQVARMLRGLHERTKSVDPPPDGASGFRVRSAAFAELFSLSREEAREVEGLAGRVESVAANATGSVLLQGDSWPGNFLHRGPSGFALVDWQFARRSRDVSHDVHLFLLASALEAVGSLPGSLRAAAAVEVLRSWRRGPVRRFLRAYGRPDGVGLLPLRDGLLASCIEMATRPYLAFGVCEARGRLWHDLFRAFCRLLPAASGRAGNPRDRPWWQISELGEETRAVEVAGDEADESSTASTADAPALSPAPPSLAGRAAEHRVVSSLLEDLTAREGAGWKAAGNGSVASRPWSTLYFFTVARGAEERSLVAKIPRFRDQSHAKTSWTSPELVRHGRSEYDSLVRLHEHLPKASLDWLATVEPEAYLSDINAIVMREVKCRSLYRAHLKLHRPFLPGSEGSRLESARRAGRLLRRVHVLPLDESRALPTLSNAEVLNTLREGSASLARFGIRLVASPRWHAALGVLGNAPEDQKVWCHCDYHPGNVNVLADGRVIALDANAEHFASPYFDLATFTASTLTARTRVLTKGALPPTRVVEGFLSEFMSAYLDGEPFSAMLLLLHQGPRFIEKWREAVSGETGGAGGDLRRRVLANPFFERLLRTWMEAVLSCETGVPVAPPKC